MDEILKYLDTIAAINDVERKLTNRKGGSDRGGNAAEIAKWDQAYDAAEAAWAAIPPEFRTRLYPPPARAKASDGPPRGDAALDAYGAGDRPHARISVTLVPGRPDRLSYGCHCGCPWDRRQ